MVSIFAPAEHDVDFDFVSTSQKLTRFVDLDVDVVLTRLGAETQLFQLSFVLFGTACLLVTLIKDLPVIHDSAHGRPGVGADFNKVQTLILSQLESFFRFHFSQHFTVSIDDTHR